jgi:hypothetical protein
MRSIVFSPAGIVPFNAEPFSCFVCDGTNVSDCAQLSFEAQSLADVMSSLGHIANIAC